MSAYFKLFYFQIASVALAVIKLSLLKFSIFSPFPFPFAFFVTAFRSCKQQIRVKRKVKVVCDSLTVPRHKWLPSQKLKFVK